MAVDSTVSLTSNDTDLSGATVTIESFVSTSGDVLTVPTADLPSGVTQNYSNGTLTLTGSATPSQYQTALCSRSRSPPR